MAAPLVTSSGELAVAGPPLAALRMDLEDELILVQQSRVYDFDQGQDVAAVVLDFEDHQAGQMWKREAVHADCLAGRVGDYQIESDRYGGQPPQDLVEKVRVVDMDNHPDLGLACDRKI